MSINLSLNLTSPLSIADGGTGQTNPMAALSSLGGIPVLASMAALISSNATTLPGSICQVEGYYNYNDDGNGLFILGQTASQNGGTIINDASGRSWYRVCLLSDLNVRWFGARGNSTADDTASIQAAISLTTNGSKIYFPPGNYLISSALAVGGSGITLMGSGKNSTYITSNNASNPCISITNGSNNINVVSMTLMHSGTPISGGDGIASLGIIDQSSIIDVNAKGNFCGFHLSSTGYGLIQNCTAQSNYSHGFYLASNANVASGGGLQWYLSECISQTNNGCGFFVQATVSGPANVTTGDFSGCRTFANTGYGFYALGLPSVPVESVRIFRCFFGQDGNDEILLDTYGYGHAIRDSYLELAGTYPTGIGGSTAISNIGNGINCTANNVDIAITNCYINAMSYNGINSSCPIISITGCHINNNGSASSAGNQNGINHAGGRMMVVGGFCGNTGGGSTQKYGITTYNGSNLSAGFIDLTGNPMGTYNATSNGPMASLIGCLPNTVAVQIPAQNGITVGAPAGGIKGPGTMNAASGIYQNGSPFTNP